MDLYLMLADYIHSPGNNSRVLACYRGFWNTACVAGVLKVVNARNGLRVVYLFVENGSGSSTIPLNGDFVVYSIVSTIPRELWITIHVAAVSTLFAIIARGLTKGRYSILGERAVLPPSLILILLFNALLIGPSYVDQSTVTLTIPGVSVSSFFSINDSSVVINIDSTGLYRLIDARCFIVNNYNYVNNVVNGSPLAVNRGLKRPIETVTINDTSIKAIIPMDYYYELYNATKVSSPHFIPTNLTVRGYINIACQLSLDKGKLSVRIPVSFNWRDLEVRSMNGVVTIYNPNPVSIKINYFITGRDLNRAIRSGEAVIDRFSSIKIPLIDHGEAEKLILQYELLGLKRVVVLELD